MMPSVRSAGWLLDLLLVAVLVTVTTVVLLGPSVPWPIVWLLGIPFLLFLPGYAIVSALFAEAPLETLGDWSIHPRDTSPDWTVRIALSLLLSAIVVAVVGVGIDWLLSIRLVPAVLGVATVTLFFAVVAAIRRSRRPADRRAGPLSGVTLRPPPTGTRIQSVTLVVAILALGMAVVFVGAAPSDGEAFTESYLLTESDDGELTAEGFPTTFVAGEGHTLSTAIENHEHRPMEYEVVVVVQAIDDDGTVSEQQQVDRFEVQLDHGEQSVVDREFAPSMTGERMRLQFRIYKNTSPEEADQPEQTLQLWIDVVEEPPA